MSLVIASASTKCRRCSNGIYSGQFKYKQRNSKSLCFDCGKPKPKVNGFIGWLLNKIK